MTDDDEVGDVVWLPVDTLRMLLDRCAAGETPDLLIAELYANSDVLDETAGEMP